MTCSAFFSALLLLAAPALVFGGGGNDDRAALPPGAKLVVASTTWIAAIARAAGAEHIRVLAPAELRHPPDYELKPSDLAAASRADLVLYAEWDTFARRLKETAGSAGVAALEVKTSNRPEDIKAEARGIAQILGTADRFASWAAAFDSLAEEIRQSVSGRWAGRRVVVERMHRPFAEWLGLDIAGEYGPAEPSPSVIAELARLRPDLVIDNYHVPTGRPIAEAAGAVYAELINFPGRDGTVTIEDVFGYNARELLRAGGGQ
ncbi:MAG: metal ABC transporter substrate-binding protein [Treponema sp.]|nr:metal ABC transporter substrate-binding protein [Treponema sp.]